MASIQFDGNVANPEMKELGGKDVVKFSVAENHQRKDRQGNWADSGTTWHRVTYWGNRLLSPAALFEAINQPKAMVMVSGRQETRSYEKDGEEKTIVEVTADKVGVLQKAGQSGGGQSRSYSSGYGQQADPWSNTAQDTGYPADPPF